MPDYGINTVGVYLAYGLIVAAVIAVAFIVRDFGRNGGRKP